MLLTWFAAVRATRCGERKNDAAPEIRCGGDKMVWTVLQANCPMLTRCD
jgi:hypothetical protein